jgi:hypothetical protein
MKTKILIMTFAMIFIIGAVYAADVSVSKSFPSRVDPNGVLTATFTITPSAATAGFDLAELIPAGWAIASWDVSNYQKSSITTDTKTQNYGGKDYAAYHWKFSDNMTSTITFTYTINVPVSSGSYDFVSIWTYPGGFSSDKKTLSVAAAPTIVCGNGACESGEDYNNCPQDCPRPQVCGNNVREGTEECDGTDLAGQDCITKGFASGTLKCTDCRFDTTSCITTIVTTCGNNLCESGEVISCPADCPAPITPIIEVSDYIYYIAIIVVIIVIGGLYYWFMAKTKPKKPYHYQYNKN